MELDPSGPDIMPFVISVAQVADHHARYRSMDEFIVAEINAYMSDPPMLFPGERMKKDQIAFL